MYIYIYITKYDWYLRSRMKNNVQTTNTTINHQRQNNEQIYEQTQSLQFYKKKDKRKINTQIIKHSDKKYKKDQTRSYEDYRRQLDVHKHRHEKHYHKHHRRHTKDRHSQSDRHKSKRISHHHHSHSSRHIHRHQHQHRNETDIDIDEDDEIKIIFIKKTNNPSNNIFNNNNSTNDLIDIIDLTNDSQIRMNNYNNNNNRINDNDDEDSNNGNNNNNNNRHCKPHKYDFRRLFVKALQSDTPWITFKEWKRKRCTAQYQTNGCKYKYWSWLCNFGHGVNTQCRYGDQCRTKENCRYLHFSLHADRKRAQIGIKIDKDNFNKDNNLWDYTTEDKDKPDPLKGRSRF